MTDAGSDFETLSLSSSGGISTLWLNRPERRNAFSPKMATELVVALAELADDSEVRVVVLRGSGGQFCSGGDLAGDGVEAEPDDRTAGEVTRDFMSGIYGPSILALHHFPKPVIAAVEGIAAGAGMNLALACDVVYAAEGARFCEIFVRRSLTLDCGGSWLLPRLVGLHKAKELAKFGEWIGARDAERLGIVADIFGSEDFDSHLAERASRLVALPPLALAEIKRALNPSFSRTIEEALDAEASAQGLLCETDDFKEAMRAFFEKRDAIFRGR